MIESATIHDGNDPRLVALTEQARALVDAAIAAVGAHVPPDQREINGVQFALTATFNAASLDLAEQISVLACSVAELITLHGNSTLIVDRFMHELVDATGRILAASGSGETKQ